VDLSHYLFFIRSKKIIDLAAQLYLALAIMAFCAVCCVTQTSEAQVEDLSKMLKMKNGR